MSCLRLLISVRAFGLTKPMVGTPEVGCLSSWSMTSIIGNEKSCRMSDRGSTIRGIYEKPKNDGVESESCDESPVSFTVVTILTN